MIDWMFPRGLTLQTFVNDGLMVVFFFLIGLEIKREIVVGQLSSVKKAILPVLAALGGMVVPALIYFSFNAGTVAAPGWGIPTATDIAFAIGILSIFSDRVPISLKIFLTALAVADDLGAILVIALFYGEEVNLLLLAIAILILIGIYFLNKVGETRIMFYLVPAFVVWALFYYSGIHSTLSGVVIAMFIPMKPRYSKEYFARKMSGLSDALLKAECRADDFPNEEHRYYLRMMSSLATDSVGMSLPSRTSAGSVRNIFDYAYFRIRQCGCLDRFAGVLSESSTLRRRPVRSARASSSDCSWASRSVFSWPVGSP